MTNDPESVLTGELDTQNTDVDPNPTGSPAPDPSLEAPGENGTESQDVSSELWPTGHPAKGHREGQESVPVKPKEDPNTYRYWQSQYDKLKREFEALQAQVEGKTKEPLNPQPAEASEPALQRPVLPSRPVDYNETDAFTDPSSSSFKYRVAMDKYRDEMVRYLETKDQLRERQEQEEKARLEARRRYEEGLSQLKVKLQTQYGLTPDQVTDFIETFSDPSSFSVDSFVELYRIKKGLTRSASTERRAAELQARDERRRVPAPAGVIPGRGEPQLDAEDAFNLSLLDAKLK